MERYARTDLAGDGNGVSGTLRSRLTQLYAQSRIIVDRFQTEVSRDDWHPFVPATYEVVEQALAPFPRGLKFLEWGSANGTITIMADMLGFEAFGIEIDPQLVLLAQQLARRFDSAAQFATGSFLPAGYRWESPTGDGRLGTIGQGESAYQTLGQPLTAFDVVFAYPWGGEEPIMLDVMQRYGREDACLLLQGADGILTFRGGERVA